MSHKTIVGAVASVALLMCTISAQERQKQFQDRAEYDLYQTLTRTADMSLKLEMLNRWEQQYPNSDFSDSRRVLYLLAYTQLIRPRQAFDTAVAVLKDNPNSLLALHTLVTFIYFPLGGPRPDASTQTGATATVRELETLYRINPDGSRTIIDQTERTGVETEPVGAGFEPVTNAYPSDLEAAEKAATYILNNLDAIIARADITEAAAAKIRPQIGILAQKAIGWIWRARKNWSRAEIELTKALDLDPNQGDVSYWLASVILAQKKPEKLALAHYHFARAAAYEGPGALSPIERQQIKAYLTVAYKRYHGSDEGLEQLLTNAQIRALPPEGFAIPSTFQVREQGTRPEDAFAKGDPQLELWKNIKAMLTSSDGANFFNTSMKEAQLPTLKGKVVKIEPPLNPKTIVMALGDGTTPDAILKVKAPLPGKVAPFTELSFEGVPESYTASPFVVVFKVDRDKLHGWTGGNAVPNGRH